MALEWSENHEVLTQLLNWAEEEVQKPTIVKLEVQHVKKGVEASESVSSLSMASTPNSPIIRSFSTGEFHWVSSIIIRDDQIILVSYDQVGVFSRPQLLRTKTFGASSAEHIVCADSNGEHVIAGCFSAKMYLWDIRSGKAVQDPLDMRRPGIYLDYPVCVRCTATEVLVGSFKGDLILWKFKNKTLALEHRWKTSGSRDIQSVDMDENFIASFSSVAHLIEVWDKTGALLFKRNDMNCMKYFNGLLYRLKRQNSQDLGCEGWSMHYDLAAS